MRFRSHLFLFSFLIFIAGILGAQTPTGTQAYSEYQGIYLVAGYGDLVETQDWSWVDKQAKPLVETLSARQLFKLGFSFKYQLFNEYKSGLFLAYTHTAFWNLLGDSSPFMETNYNPEAFFRFKTKDNFAGNADLGLLDHFQIGVEHNSNGVSGPDSRAFDKIYTEASLGFGEKVRIEVATRYFVYFHQFPSWTWYKPETVDMQLYRSNMLFSVHLSTPGAGLFFLPRDILVKAAPGGGYNSFDITRGFVSAQVTFGSLFGGLSPYGELFLGTGESLINYADQGMSLRIGLRAF